MKITDGGVRHNNRGLIIMFGCCGMPGGVNPNDKTVMINPPGAYHNGGVNENLTPARPKRQRFSTVSGLLNSRCSSWHLLDYHSCTLLILPSFRRVLRQCPHPTDEGHTSCLFVCKTFITVHKYKNINYFQIHITV